MAAMVWRIRALAEAYRSQQPFRPQVHCSPPWTMTMWPPSPAQPLMPVWILPFKMMPVPMPVPRVTRIRLSMSLSS